MKTLAIFGSSGFAREVGDIADALGFETIFIAREPADVEAWSGPETIGLEREVVERYAGLPFAIGIGDNVARQRVHARYRERLRFVSLIHPAASFGKRQRARLDGIEGVVVNAGARFMNHIEVGRCAVVGLNATIGHDSVIGDFAFVAPGAVVSGQVELGAGCWIGGGAVVNQGASGRRLAIGAGTVIGSGCVVLHDCEPGAVYVGNPARRLR